MKKMRLWSKKFLPVLIFCGSCLITAGLLATEKKIEPQVVKVELPVVRVLAVEPKMETMRVVSEGVLKPKVELDLAVEVSGRVTWVSDNLASGAYFEKGELLLTIDEAPFITAKEQALATLEKAKAEYRMASEEHERLKQLHRKKLASQSSLDQAERALSLSRSEKRLAVAALADADRELGKSRILAPFSGRVKQERVEVGQYLSVGTVMADIYAREWLEVRLPIPSQQMQFLDPVSSNNPANVEFTARYAGTEYQWQGRLVRLEAELDSQSRMTFAIAKVRASDLPDYLPVGLFVKAVIEGKQIDQVVRLHRGALRNNNQVVLIDDQDRIRLPEVEVLRHEGDFVLVSGGLPAGSRICDSHIEVVVEGMKVNPVLLDNSYSLGQLR